MKKITKREEAQKAVDTINKTYGGGSVMWLSSNEGIKVERIPTGSIILDRMTGGGIPRARMTEIFGIESSGKTLIAAMAMIEAQRLGGVVAIVDLENAFYKDFYVRLGGDLDRTIIAKPATAEDAWSVAESLIESGLIDLLVFDSLAALATGKEMEGDMGDSNMGIMARLNSQAMRKLTGKIAKTKTAVVLISQTRTNIGAWGDPNISVGGKAVKFYTSIRIKTTKGKALKSGDNVVGHELILETVKNKTFPPFKKGLTKVMYSVGIDRISEIIEIGLENKMIEKAGSWFSVFGEKTQGQEGLWLLLADNPEMQEAILEGKGE